jgi:hypothetical protein
LSSHFRDCHQPQTAGANPLVCLPRNTGVNENLSQIDSRRKRNCGSPARRKHRFTSLERYAFREDKPSQIRICTEKMAQKLRGGQPTEGVEGLPGTGCPLDPGPGLGGILSLGLFRVKASPFLNKIPVS